MCHYLYHYILLYHYNTYMKHLVFDIRIEVYTHKIYTCMNLICTYVRTYIHMYINELTRWHTNLLYICIAVEELNEMQRLQAM